MLGSLLRLAAGVMVTLVMAVVALATIPFDRTGRLYHGVSRLWSRTALRVCGVRVRVTGTEHLVPGRSYIYVSNHASMFDIPVVAAGIPDDIRIVYKRELEKVPLFGWGLRWSNYIGIDRGRSAEARRSLDEAVEKIRGGASVLLFGEGTRTEDGKLQPFKRGAFSLAAKSGVPIVPIAINGSFKILPKSSLDIRPSPIELVIEKPIETTQIFSREEELIMLNRVRGIIERNYREDVS